MKYIHAKLDIQRNDFHLDVDLSIKRGEITALYGASGSGKSSILRFIAGFEANTHNTNTHKTNIRTDSEIWSNQNTFLAPHLRGIGYVFQHDQLFPHLDVLGNLQYAIQRKHQQTPIELEQVKQWLGIEHLLNKSINELSGGEKQRVSIARVLLNGASALLMDEALGALDQRAKQRILPYIDQLHERLDFPFLYVSHALDEVSYLADSIYLIEAGKIVDSGSLFELGLKLNTGQEDAAAIIQCEFKEFNSNYKLTTLDFESQNIHLAGDRSNQSKLKLKIPARDVSIALSRNTDSSILNILEGEIEAIRQNPEDSSALIRVKVGTQYILSRITRRSLDKLHLETGQRVFLQIKSLSFFSELSP